MNNTKRNDPPPPDFGALLEPLRLRLGSLGRSARSPYNWLATTLTLAAFLIFFIDVKGSVVALAIFYLLAILRLQLTRRGLELRRLEVESARLDLEQARFERESGARA